MSSPVNSSAFGGASTGYCHSVTRPTPPYPSPPLRGGEGGTRAGGVRRPSGRTSIRWARRSSPRRRSSDGNAKVFNELRAIVVARHREADSSPTSSIRRKRPGRGCAEGRPASAY
jgi:hypothetical protein